MGLRGGTEALKSGILITCMDLVLIFAKGNRSLCC
jgi:hypothetical protein